MAQSITLDITSLTLGEAVQAEEQSGKSIQTLLKGRANMLLLAVFVNELRSSAEPRSWSELSSLSLLDVSSSISQSLPDGQSARSNG